MWLKAQDIKQYSKTRALQNKYKNVQREIHMSIEREMSKLTKTQ